jgi:hypothetical protein
VLVIRIWPDPDYSPLVPDRIERSDLDCYKGTVLTFVYNFFVSKIC